MMTRASGRSAQGSTGSPSASSGPAWGQPRGTRRSIETHRSSLLNGGQASPTTATSSSPAGSGSNPSTSSSAGTPASPSPTPASDGEPTTSATYGRTSSTPFAYYDRPSLCLRTSQGTFLSDSMSCSVTLPKSGSMRGGELFGHRTWVLPTDASACSSLLTTPRATRGGSSTENAYALLPTPTAWEQGSDSKWDERIERLKNKGYNGNGAGEPLDVAVRRLLPSPRTSDSNGIGEHGDGGADLRTAVSLLPTPRAADHKGATEPSECTAERVRTGEANLSEAVQEVSRLMPTPTSRDHKGQNQRGDDSCLPGAITSLQSGDGSEPSDDQLPLRWTDEDG